MSYKNIYNQSQTKSRSLTSSQNSQSNLNFYNCITKYNKLTPLPELKKHEQILRKFIQNLNDKVLFVFGPSGCGKHILVSNFIKKHNIPYQYRAQKVSYNNNNNQFDFGFQGLDLNQNTNNRKITSLRQLIIQSISKTNLNKVQIYQDFPIPTTDTSKRQLQSIKQFKYNFFSKIPKSQCKIIFILNSQIYNKYYILPKECPQQITQIVLKPYSITETKTILKQFTAEYQIFDWVCRSKDILDEIIQISNGDMRKVLLNVYKQTMDRQTTKMQYMGKQQKIEYKLKLKNQQRFPLFHMLGKFLYAKRYDTLQKKDRVFAKEQLKKRDPPFYFKPVEMYQKSLVPLSTFTDLLYQNYVNKIATVQDAIQITKLFSHLDTMFPAFITNKKIDSISQQSQKLYIFLLTWGIILKNKSSSLIDKKFTNFRKSQYRYMKAEIETKQQLLSKYFPFTNRSNLVRWGYIVKNSKTTKPYLIANLIKKRVIVTQFLRDQNEKAIGEQQEQQLMKKEENSYDNDFIESYKRKKKAKQAQLCVMRQIEMQYQDSSDIDN